MKTAAIVVLVAGAGVAAFVLWRRFSARRAADEYVAMQGDTHIGAFVPVQDILCTPSYCPGFGG